jgi:hypothetical protein
MGIGMDALAAFMIYYGIKKENQPQQVYCVPGGNSMNILGANGAQMGQIFALPGGGYRTVGAYGQVPQYAAQQMYSICPNYYQPMNYAMAPPYLPMNYSTVNTMPYGVGTQVPYGQAPVIVPMSPQRPVPGVILQQKGTPATGYNPGAGSR